MKKKISIAVNAIKKQFLILLPSIAIMAMVSIVLSSCKDDEPVIPPKVSMGTSELEVKESDETLEIEVILDRPAPKDIVIEYSLDGTAIELKDADDENDPDYEIKSELGEIEIAKGETIGIIEIDLYSDLLFENTPETIIVKLESVDEGIELTNEDELEITLLQEDGLIIALAWPNPTPGSSADMDLIVRIGESISNFDGILTASAHPGFMSPEFVFIPSSIPDAAFGVSYNYYEGNIDPLDFTATYVDYINGEFETQANQQVFEGTYTVANINT